MRARSRVGAEPETVDELMAVVVAEHETLLEFVVKPPLLGGLTSYQIQDGLNLFVPCVRLIRRGTAETYRG